MEVLMPLDNLTQNEIDEQKTDFGYDIAPKNSFYNEVFYDLDKPTYVEAWIGGQIGIRL